MKYGTMILIFAIAMLSGGCHSPFDQLTAKVRTDYEGAVSRTLDDFHDAAAKADEKRYFDHFAENAVFLGTDAKERWTLEEFRAFAHPYFAKGKAWTYTPLSRHVVIEDKAHNTAWFDEQLENAKLGVCRGSGVLIKIGGEHGQWKIKQYNLTMLVPNEIADKVAKMASGPLPAK